MSSDDRDRKKKKGRKRRGNGDKDDNIEVPDEKQPTGKNNSKLDKKMTGGHKKDKLEEINANRDYAKEYPDMIYDFDPEFDPTYHPIKVMECMSEGASPEELCVEH